MAEAVLDWDTMVDGNLNTTIGPQEAYRIRYIGTDKAGAIAPTIDGNRLGTIRTEIGALHPVGTAEQGLLDLEEQYYYLPPEGTLELNGAASDTVRLQGEAVDGPSGRFETSADETRYSEQGSRHYTFVQGSTDVSEPIADNAEFEPFVLTPATDERFTFDGLHLVSHSSTGSLTISEGDVAYLFDFDGQQRPSQFQDDAVVGLDHTTLPRPPTDTTDQRGFVYGDRAPNVEGFTVQGDRTYRVVGRNVSGGSLGSSTETSTFTYQAVVDFAENV